MALAAPIGIFGGTFDPVHFGHLRSALEVWQSLALAEVRFIPCHLPPHRQQPLASPAQRLRMLELALERQPALVIDTRELARSGPSYMVDTLSSLRAELGETPLCLLLGSDAFAGLPGWHRWKELVEIAHLVVMHRPGWAGRDAVQPVLQAMLARREVHEPERLAQQPAGLIRLQPVTQLDISATAVRALMRTRRSPRYLLPDVVLDYMEQEGMYRD